jgi:subtilisin family serine protease
VRFAELCDARLGEGMTTDSAYKLDPRLRTTSARKSKSARRTNGVRVFIEVASNEARKSIRSQKWLRQFTHIVDGYCSAIVPRSRLKELASSPGVIEVEASRYLKPQLDSSVESINAREHVRGLPVLSHGAGVVVGIVDYGIDFTLEDFRWPDNKKNTRIRYLWDQELSRQGEERRPSKYKYGVEYSSSDIDKALATNDPFKNIRHNPLHAERAISGHGTHVAGIAAGNGLTHDPEFPMNTYVGVAPGAEIVFVHLDRKAVLSEVETTRGTLANSVHLAHAIAYCFEKADELGLPCVVNLSMGFNGGGHDGNSAVEWVIDALLQKPGRSVVIAAGNENRPGKAIYKRGTVRRDPVEIGWESGFMIAGRIPKEDTSPNELEIWYSPQFALRVQLIAPKRDEASPPVNPGDEPKPFTFRSGEEVIITSDPRTAWDGAARITIRLSKGKRTKGIRTGVWLIRLEALGLADGQVSEGVRFDAWIERTIPDDAPMFLRSRFKDFDARNAITVTTPGTSRSALTVASCDSRNPFAISDFSGRGPTRDGRSKPDIAAPGESVASSNAGAARGSVPARRRMQGTSMSAPHVTGVVARLLSEQNFLTATEIKEILIQTADRPAGANPTDWHPEYGWGRVNAAVAIQLLRDKMASPPRS